MGVWTDVCDISSKPIKVCPVQICMPIGLKMEAGDCPTLNMNAMENYLLSHSLIGTCLQATMTWKKNILMCVGITQSFGGTGNS